MGRVVPLSADRADDVVATFSESFHDYPVMRFVVGEAGDDYHRRLERLVRFFVMNRVWRGEPMFGVLDDGQVVAAATVTPPGDRPRPAEVEAARTDLWAALGDEARARYEALGTVWQELAVTEPHHHLNMIGVRQRWQGRKLARLLLHEVGRLSARDPGSAGVSLTTEDPANVPLYEHLGFSVIGHARIEPDLETWTFFHPRSSS